MVALQEDKLWKCCGSARPWEALLCHLQGWGGGRWYLLVLGVEELDEALEEVGALLHLTLPSFEQVLGEGDQGCVT